jgi:hypothetical protein
MKRENIHIKDSFGKNLQLLTKIIIDLSNNSKEILLPKINKCNTKSLF